MDHISEPRRNIKLGNASLRREGFAEGRHTRASDGLIRTNNLCASYKSKQRMTQIKLAIREPEYTAKQQM